MNNFGDDQTALVVIIVRPEDGLAFAAADETSADRRQGLLKSIGRNLRQAAVASLAPVVAELLRPTAKKKAAATK